MAQEPILIIDDNPSNVKLARLLLANAGYEVRTAGDSEEALEVLKSFTPRLILMDIQLPGMDGLQLTRLLKQDPQTRAAIIVAVTAYAMRGDEERTKAAGCDGYLSKPIDTRLFVGQVRQYLEKSPAPPSAPKQERADPNDLLRELRQGFIAEGLESSQRYAGSESADDLEGMRRVVHRWAGMGGTLGFPEITRRAREIEATLENAPAGTRPSQEFTQMHDLFALAMGASEAHAVSPDLIENLAAKQVGLIGFDEAEAKRARDAFEQVHATARDLGAVSKGLSTVALRAYDLIVLNTCSEEGIRTWESVLAQPILEKPVLLVSSRTALMDPRLALLDRAVDFVLAPWDSEELLCRARRMIGQKPKPVPRQEERSVMAKVLIADDDQIIHTLLSPMLAKMGVEVHSARDGQETLDSVRVLSPDLLVLDIGMPKMSGMAVLREIRRAQNNHKLQILMLSARQHQNDIGMAFAYGANDYAVKPFDPEDVVLRIMRLLRQPAASLTNVS